MAGKSGYRATVKLGGTAITEADNVEITADGEEFDVTDLGDYLVQKVPGALDINVTGEATFLGYSGSILSRVHGAFSGTASFAITITLPPATSAALSGTGYYTRGGLNQPRGAIKQPFAFHVNAVTVP